MLYIFVAWFACKARIKDVWFFLYCINSKETRGTKKSGSVMRCCGQDGSTLEKIVARWKWFICWWVVLFPSDSFLLISVYLPNRLKLHRSLWDLSSLSDLWLYSCSCWLCISTYFLTPSVTLQTDHTLRLYPNLPPGSSFPATLIERMNRFCIFNMASIYLI